MSDIVVQTGGRAFLRNGEIKRVTALRLNCYGCIEKASADEEAILWVHNGRGDTANGYMAAPLSAWEELATQILRQRNWRVAAPGEHVDGEVVWQADTFDGQLAVVAKGNRFLLVEVEGNFPVDYIEKHFRFYDTEDDAVEDAHHYLECVNSESDDDFDPFVED